MTRQQRGGAFTVDWWLVADSLPYGIERHTMDTRRDFGLRCVA